jgi:hypothetical protein
MQRHRYDTIRQQTAPFRQGSGKQITQQSSVGQASAKFQILDQRIQRRLVAKRYKGAVKVRRGDTAAAAEFGDADR